MQPQEGGEFAPIWRVEHGNGQGRASECVLLVHLSTRSQLEIRKLERIAISMLLWTVAL
jgi:hypothetical protein